jgi:hypothetical protein
MTEIEQLRMENERLYSHHSDCKAMHGRLVDIANKWRIRAYVLEKLLGWLNHISPWWHKEDLKTEIEMHTARLFEKHNRREPWWKDEEKLWATR